MRPDWTPARGGDTVMVMWLESSGNPRADTGAAALDKSDWPGKGRLRAGGTVWENRLCSEDWIGGKTGVCLQQSEGQKTNSG